jgi:hypothetical protein
MIMPCELESACRDVTIPNHLVLIATAVGETRESRELVIVLARALPRTGTAIVERCEPERAQPTPLQPTPL